MLSLWCLSVLLLFGTFPGQLVARASCWCSVVCCFLAILPGFHWLYVRAPTKQRWASGVRRAGRCRPNRTLFSFTGCWSCRDTVGFMIRTWDPILSGWRWLYGLQPIRDRPTGLVFSHRAGWCRPEGILFSSPGCRSFSDAEGLLNRGWGPILPGCHRSTRPSQSAIGSCDLGSTPCGAVSNRENSIFVPGVS